MTIPKQGHRLVRSTCLPLVGSMLAVAIFFLVAPMSAFAVPTKPPTDTSYYVQYPYNGTGTPDVSSNAYALGCDQAQFDTVHSDADSEVVLNVGAQNSGDTGTYLPLSNTPATYANIEHYAETFAYGYWVCTGNGNTTSLMALAIATNNSGSTVTSAEGAGWATVTKAIYDWTTTGTYSAVGSQVIIYGGSDMEPAWSSQSSTIAWADGYSTNSPLFYIDDGSCDGCPPTATTGNGYSFLPCPSGCTSWNQYGVWDIAWGEAGALPLPQIYVYNQEGEWAAISDYGDIAKGSTVYFEGPLDEHDRDSSTYTSSQAWTNFWNALQGFGGAIAQTPTFSDEIAATPS